MARLSRLYGVQISGLTVLFTLFSFSAPGVRAEEAANGIAWQTDYRAALAQAKANKTLAIIWFFNPQENDESEKFERVVLRDSQVQLRLRQFSLVKLPLDAAVAENADGDTSIVLLEHAAFAEMLHQPGLAMIDMRDDASPHFHHVVSVYPIVGQGISCPGLVAMLDLPAGSLTQRTLIWAVRTHPEQPRSAAAEYSPLLAGEAQSHARHQASINLQGHHQWDQRFQDINSRLGSGMVSREVCAESWPGQRLVEAAEECVHSWRQSGGHWEAVSGQHSCFGYDMKLGSSGVWYATGIFGDRR